MKVDTAFFFGANSDVCKELVNIYCKKGNIKIYLFSRNTKSLNSFKIKKKLNNIKIFKFDMNNLNYLIKIIKQTKSIPNYVFFFNGLMDNHLKYKEVLKKNSTLCNVNFLSITLLIEYLIKRSLKTKTKTKIVVLTSVAGIRGKKNNIIYSASKAALINYLSGIRQKFFKKGISICTIIPGYLKTKMTRNLNLPKLLTTSPDKFALQIYKVVSSDKDVYMPTVWKIIIFFIKLIPEKIFKRLAF